MKKRSMKIMLICGLLTGIAAIGTLAGLTKGFRDWNIGDNVQEGVKELRKVETYGISKTSFKTFLEGQQVTGGFKVEDLEVVDHWSIKDFAYFTDKDLTASPSRALISGVTYNEGSVRKAFDYNEHISIGFDNNITNIIYNKTYDKAQHDNSCLTKYTTDGQATPFADFDIFFKDGKEDMSTLHGYYLLEVCAEGTLYLNNADDCSDQKLNKDLFYFNCNFDGDYSRSLILLKNTAAFKTAA